METWEAGGYAIQRQCPHLKADLTKFGSVEDGILTVLPLNPRSNNFETR